MSIHSVGGPRGSWDEHRSKMLLADYGVPVARERAATDPDEVVPAARELGWPVVVKGLGSGLAHKSDLGLVRLGLGSEAEVLDAARDMQALGGKSLEGFLVQPLIEGRRELMVGLVRDPGYGPVLMFGLGGVDAEVLNAVALRLLPIERRDAEELLEEGPAAALLGAVRGEKPADREALVRLLLGLSRLAEQRPDVQEVDVNPLLLTPQGEVVAVDALVVTAEPAPAAAAEEHVSPEALGRLFYPRSLAMVGASEHLGKWGHLLLTNLLAGGFPGNVYLVNPTGGEIAGMPVYPDLESIPGKVDLGVFAVPAAAVEPALPALAAKGSAGAVVVSSGYAELGEEGARLERSLVTTARNLGLVLIGPNTMGITNPHARLYCTGSHVRPHAGSTALVAQSGNLGTQLLAFAEQQGLGIRAFCGSGNEAMVTIEDYMQAFEVDEVTRAVVLYLEGLKEPRRFFTAARRVSLSKPVVVLKGGRTKGGGRAAASHTGAMAGEHVLFANACRQCGVLEVRQPMDLLDLSAAFSSLPLPAGRRVAIMTLGGGWGVVATDLCEEHGLEVPPLPPDLVEAIDPLLPPFWSRANPVDLVGTVDPEAAARITRILAEWEGCDAVLNLGILGQRLFMGSMLESVRRVQPSLAPAALNALGRRFETAERDYVDHVVRIMTTTGKPVLGVKLLEEDTHRTLYESEAGPYRGVFFQTPERAVRSLSRLVEYAGWRACRRC